MTPNEKLLLMLVANWAAEAEENTAAKLGTTSHVAEEMRRLINAIREGKMSGY